MSKKIVPTYRFSAYSDVTPEFLRENGIKGILTDLDSTLTEHNSPLPDKKLLSWLSCLKSAGIPVCIVSNNKSRRTVPFAVKTGIGCICNAAKPYRPGLRLGLSVIACKPAEAVFIGDQLYTDIKGAENAGMRSILVEPVGTKTTAFIKFKRLLERRQN